MFMPRRALISLSAKKLVPTALCLQPITPMIMECSSDYDFPASKHAEGEMRQIYDWDTKEYHGQIPEASETYNVIGNINEYPGFNWRDNFRRTA